MKGKALRPKIPSRRDSKEVVESIVEAAMDILAKEGMEALTTNRIAERAGVGVASVYRYFKDKVAIVAEIDLRNRKLNADRVVGALTTALQKTSETNSTDADAKLVAVIRSILDSFLDTKDARSRIRRALVTEVPLSWVSVPAGESWSQVIHAAALALLNVRPDLSLEEAKRRVFIALHAVQGIVIGQLVFPHADMTHDEAVTYVERMITPFLLSASSSPKPPVAD